MKVYSRLLLATLLSFFTSSICFSEDWITEEVLTQLTEIRQELSALRAEVSALKGTQLGKENQQPTSISISLANDKPILGDKNAEIVVMEFSDYQCPYCKRHANNTLPLIKEYYVDTGRVQYAMMDFPLGFHSLAKPTAIAIRCAGRQSESAYWEFHDHFFGDKPDALTKASYQILANDLKLDVEALSDCIADPLVSDAVDAEMAYGTSIGVSGTPAFFIGIKDGDKITNTQFLSGAQPYSVFSQVIDELIDGS